MKIPSILFEYWQDRSLPNESISLERITNKCIKVSFHWGVLKDFEYIYLTPENIVQEVERAKLWLGNGG